jgi:hypothetical protein
MQKDTVVSIEASDGGDGSTFFTINFQDGSSISENPDLPYDGELLITYADGVRKETVTYRA